MQHVTCRHVTCRHVTCHVPSRHVFRLRMRGDVGMTPENREILSRTSVLFGLHARTAARTTTLSAHSMDRTETPARKNTNNVRSCVHVHTHKKYTHARTNAGMNARKHTRVRGQSSCLRLLLVTSARVCACTNVHAPDFGTHPFARQSTCPLPPQCLSEAPAQPP